MSMIFVVILCREMAKRARSKTSSSSLSPLTRQVRALPRDLQSVVISKLPVYEQKVVNKAQYELNRLQALVFRDFFKDIVRFSRNVKEDMFIVFNNRFADQYDIKKTTIANKDNDDANGEYSINVNKVSDVDTTFYAGNMYENVMISTDIECSKNVADIVRNLCEKLFPRVKVRIISKRSSTSPKQI